MKGVGRIYQQTFIDTYAKVAFAKLYDRKTPITAADLLNDRVVPFYDAARGEAVPRADRSRHGILRQSRAPRIRALSGGRGCRPFAHQDQEPANEWHRRAVPQDGARTSSTASPSARRSTARSPSCRRISTSGSEATTKTDPIRVRRRGKLTEEARRFKHLLPVMFGGERFRNDRGMLRRIARADPKITPAGRAARLGAKEKACERVWAHQRAATGWRAGVANWREVELDVGPIELRTGAYEPAALIDAERQWSASTEEISECGPNPAPPRSELLV